MATYTYNESANPPVLAWIQVDGTIASINAAGTELVLNNSDGTLSVFTGTGLAGTTGAAGTLTAGTLTGVSRTNAARTVTFETITGFSYPATNADPLVPDFNQHLPEATLEGIVADILAGNDTLNGSSADNFFQGFAGNDTVNGGSGLDTIRYSGPFHSGPISVLLGATSTITGNATVGTDTLSSVESVVGANSFGGSGTGGDTFVATGAFAGSLGPFNMFEGRDGNDTITGNGNTRISYNEAESGVTVNLAQGTAQGRQAGNVARVGVDTIVSGVNSIQGSQFSDILVGNGGANVLIGQRGTDQLRGLVGADQLFGGSGFDYADYFNSTGTSGLTANLAAPGQNTGDAAADSYDSVEGLIGSDFADVLIGNDGGLNILVGRAGADQLIGAGGFDYAGYQFGATAGVIASLAAPTGNTGDAAGDTYDGIEGLVGTNLADTLTGNASSNRIAGNGGADAIDGQAGFDYAAYWTSEIGLTVSLLTPSLNTGEAAGDTYTSIEGLVGSDFDDTLSGDDLGNRLIGRMGADRLEGAGGRDYASYDYAEYYLRSSAPVVVSLLNPGANDGEAAGDTYDSIEGLIGTDFNDTLTGDGLSNFLAGGVGGDGLDGQAGIDYATYFLADAGVRASLTNPAGNTGEAAGDSYTSIEGLVGSNLADTLIGNDTANGLFGLAGADTLLGDDAVLSTTNALSAARLYVAAFGRTATAAELESATAALDAGTPLAALAASLATSSEFTSVYGGLSNTAFVTALYNTVLDRGPDAGGQANWEAYLAGGASRSDTLIGFSQSIEFSIVTDPEVHAGRIFRAFEAAFNRAPDASGFETATEALAGGAGLPSVISGFAASQEFANLYGALSDTQFVTALYNNVLDRGPDAGGLANWVGFLANGQSRAFVVQGFSESLELNLKAADAIVSFMRTGVAQWNDVIEGGAGNDNMAGGRGNDTFIFRSSDVGADDVFGVEAWDTVQMFGFGYASSADALSHMTQSGVDVLFSDQGQTIRFHDAQLSTLSQVSYAFAPA